MCGQSGQYQLIEKLVFPQQFVRLPLMGRKYPTAWRVTLHISEALQEAFVVLFCLSWERARYSPELARLSWMILLFLLPKCGHYGRMSAFLIYAMKQIRPGLCDTTQALHQPRCISSLCCFTVVLSTRVTWYMYSLVHAHGCQRMTPASFLMFMSLLEDVHTST